MTAAQTDFHKRLPLLGLFLLAAGLAALFAEIHPLATQVWQRAGVDALGEVLPAAVLAVNHAAQAWAFDRSNLFSTLGHMLLSFWPVIPILMGLMLLGYVMSKEIVARQLAPRPDRGENA